MELSEWQKQQGLSDKEFAKLWGYADPSMIWLIKKKLRMPSPKKAKKLIEISNGELSLNDIYSLSEID